MSPPAASGPVFPASCGGCRPARGCIRRINRRKSVSIPPRCAKDERTPREAGELAGGANRDLPFTGRDRFLPASRQTSNRNGSILNLLSAFTPNVSPAGKDRRGPEATGLPAPLIRLPSPPNGAIRLTAAPPGYRRLPSSTPRSEGRDRPGQAPHSAGRPKVNHRNSIILGESIIDNNYQYQYINISNPGGGSRPVPLPEKKHPLPLVKPQKCRHVKTPGLCGVLTPVFYRRQLV